MTDAEVLQQYVSLVPFLAAVCGPGCEVVVHDITDPEHSLIAICNGVSGREVGDPLTDLARDLAARGAYADTDYLLNYAGKSKKVEFLSSTFYIKNKQRLIGMLCINKDITAVQELNGAVQRLLDRFNLRAAPEGEYSENLDNPLASMVYTRIADTIAQSGIPPARMSRREKMRIVHQLDESGVTLMKGAIAEIANQLSISVPTVYRYLNQPADE